MKRTTALGMCLVLSLVGAACTAEDGPIPASPSPSPTPSVVTATGPSDCPEEVGAAETETEPAQSSLMGDVDGDGELDSISIRSFLDSEPGCQAVLTVLSSDSVLSVPIEQEGVDLGGGAPPSLLGVADIDGRSGNEIIVRLVSGASTEFTGVYSAEAGTLERLPVRGGEFGDLFPSGGSVGHFEQSDCAGAGTVMIATAVPDGARYLVRRAEFVFDGEAFARDRSASSEVTVSADELASGAVPGFTSSAPFGSCPTD